MFKFYYSLQRPHLFSNAISRQSIYYLNNILFVIDPPYDFIRCISFHYTTAGIRYRDRNYRTTLEAPRRARNRYSV